MELEAPDTFGHPHQHGQESGMGNPTSIIEGLSKILSMGIADILDLPAAGHEHHGHQQHHELSHCGHQSKGLPASEAVATQQQAAAAVAGQDTTAPHMSSTGAAHKGSGKRLGAKRVQPKPRITDDAVPAPDVGMHLPLHQDSSTHHLGTGASHQHISLARTSTHMHELASHGSSFADGDVEYQYRRAQAGLTQQRSRGVYDLLMQGVSSFTQKATDLLDTIDTRMDSLFNADLHPHAAEQASSSNNGQPAMQPEAVAAAAAQLVNKCSHDASHQCHQSGRGKLHARLLSHGQQQQGSAGGTHKPMEQQQQHGTLVKHTNIGLRQPRRSADAPRIIIPPSPHNKVQHGMLQGCSNATQTIMSDQVADASAHHAAYMQHGDQPAAAPTSMESDASSIQHDAGLQVALIDTQDHVIASSCIDSEANAAGIQGPATAKPAGQPPFNPSCPGCQHSKKLLIKARKRCSELVEENTKLRGVGLLDPILADSVCQQLESLLADKARLLADNHRLQREHAGLQQLLAYAWELHTAHLEEHAATVELLYTAQQPQQSASVYRKASHSQLEHDHDNHHMPVCNRQYSLSCPPSGRQRGLPDGGERHQDLNQTAPRSCPQQKRCTSSANVHVPPALHAACQHTQCDGSCNAQPACCIDLAAGVLEQAAWPATECPRKQHSQGAANLLQLHSLAVGHEWPGEATQTLSHRHQIASLQHDECSSDYGQHEDVGEQLQDLLMSTSAAAACPTPHRTPAAPCPSLATSQLSAPYTPTSCLPCTPYTPAVAITPNGAHHHEVAPVVQYYEHLLAGIAKKEPPPPGLDLPYDSQPAILSACTWASTLPPCHDDAAAATAQVAKQEGCTLPATSPAGLLDAACSENSSHGDGPNAVSSSHNNAAALAMDGNAKLGTHSPQVTWTMDNPQLGGSPTLLTTITSSVLQQPHEDLPQLEGVAAVGMQPFMQSALCADSLQRQDAGDTAEACLEVHLLDAQQQQQQHTMQAENSSRWGSTCSMHNDGVPSTHCCSSESEQDSPTMCSHTAVTATISEEQL